jgi:hypothetical protein
MISVIIATRNCHRSASRQFLTSLHTVCMQEELQEYSAIVALPEELQAARLSMLGFLMGTSTFSSCQIMFQMKSAYTCET